MNPIKFVWDLAVFIIEVALWFLPAVFCSIIAIFIFTGKVVIFGYILKYFLS
jgi:hypothetical protein